MKAEKVINGQFQDVRGYIWSSISKYADSLMAWQSFWEVTNFRRIQDWILSVQTEK